MADNKYRQYLTYNPNNPKNKDDSEGSSPRSSFIPAIIAGGVVGALGIFAGTHAGKRFFNEAFNGETVSKYTSAMGKWAEEQGAYGRALEKTFQSAGTWGTLTGKAEKEFTRNLRVEYANIGRTANRKIRGSKTMVEKVSEGYSNAINKATQETVYRHRQKQIADVINSGQYSKEEKAFLNEALSNNRKFIEKSLRKGTGVSRLKSMQYQVNRYTEGKYQKSIDSDPNMKHLFDDVLTKIHIGQEIKSEKDTLSVFRNALTQKQQSAFDNNLDKLTKSITKAAYEKVIEQSGLHSNLINKAGFQHATIGQAQVEKVFGQGTSVDAFIGNIKTVLGDDAWNTMLNSRLDNSIGYNSATGAFNDFRFISQSKDAFLDSAARNIQVPFVGIKPFKYVREAFKRGGDEPIFEHFHNKTNLQTVGLDASQGEYVFFGNKLIDMEGNIVQRTNSLGEKVDDYFNLADATSGETQRLYGAMIGDSHKKPIDTSTVVGKIRKWLDIGTQETEASYINNTFGILTKFKDPKWAPNTLKYGKSNAELLLADQQTETATFIYNKLYGSLNSNTSKLDVDTFSSVIEALESQGANKDIVALAKMYAEATTNEQKVDVMRMYMSDMGFYGKAASVQGQQTLNPLRIKNWIDEYDIDPDDFNRVIDTAHVNGATVPLTRLDKLEKQFQMNILHNANSTATKTRSIYQGASEEDYVFQVIDSLKSSGHLNSIQSKKVENLWMLTRLQEVTETGSIDQLSGNQAKDFVLKFLVGEERAALTHAHSPVSIPKSYIESNRRIEEVIDNVTGTLDASPQGEVVKEFANNKHIVVRKSINPVTETIKAINAAISGGATFKDVMRTMYDTTIKQAGFDFGAGLFDASLKRAGRDNMGATTRATMNSFFMFNRLSDGLGTIGLGLGRNSTGSTQDVGKNLLLKRWIGPAALITGAWYLNDEIGNITGQEPSDAIASANATTRVDVQRIKDFLGINKFTQDLQRYMPGIGRGLENPIGMAANAATFGILGEDRGADELEKYYKEGYDPIRKGRFWGFGSNSPYYGGRVEYFRAPSYRRILGEPDFTDVKYGSEAEYWAHSWLPNPRNPLGVISRLWDANHWSDKHRDDRPYPMSGGVQELQELPLIGPLLNSTIGELINPTRRRGDLEKAHRQYIREINESIKAQVNLSQDESYVANITPGGRVTFGNIDPNVIVSNANNAIVAESQSGGTTWYSSNVLSEDMSRSARIRNIARNNPGRGTLAARDSIRFQNNYIAKQAFDSQNDNTINTLMDHTDINRLDEAVDPTSAQYRLSETRYSAQELAGIYGFFGQTIFGDTKSKIPVLAHANRMTSLSRDFWDERLGGMGGELSEIYRRFMPRDQDANNTYNPYRNQMPDWLPGLSYFKDFKHGDPYSSLPNAEELLPGAGYEAVNKLHPDSLYGRYGAVDRLNILANVAPWSEQYTYYAKVVTQMHNQGLLSEEDYEFAQNARKMAKERKKQLDVVPYKFKYNRVDTKQVTIARMIDDTTFFTEELPGVPIRMAGIDMPNKDGEQYEEAKRVLNEFIAPGKQVTIGTSGDPLMEISKDSMNTTRAVVYVDGDSLQAKLARSELGFKARWDSNDPIVNEALYYNWQKQIGRAWEGFAHADFPILNKFLGVQSPLEMYKRQLVFGKQWQSWEHPIRDWVRPTLDKLTSYSPLEAAGIGGVIGGLVTIAAPGMRTRGALIGAGIAGTLSSFRAINEAAHRTLGDTDYTWIPERTRKQRELDEYFDMLTYVKYKGLYSKAAQDARQKEGVNPDDIQTSTQLSEKYNSKAIRRLENIKKWIKYSMSDTNVIDTEEAGIKLQYINDALNMMKEDTIAKSIGPYAARALKYKQQMESTLYGADPNGDLMNIYRAIPKKERPFFKYLMTAKPEEREEILRLVPKNQRRFFQAKWGLKVDAKVDLDKYFDGKYVPDHKWRGWSEDTSLEQVKLKFLDNEAMDISQFGFYSTDLNEIGDTPSLGDHTPLSNPFNIFDTEQLKRVLRGKGLKDVEVDLINSYSNDPDDIFRVVTNFVQDRTKDIANAIDKWQYDLINDNDQ